MTVSPGSIPAGARSIRPCPMPGPVAAAPCGYHRRVLWAISLVVLIGAGLPVTAWSMTRGRAGRPSGPLAPYRTRTEVAVHQRYGLDWPDCSLVLAAVSQGRRAPRPALEPAARALAADTLAGRAPGQRVPRVLSRVNLVLGIAMIVFPVIVVVLHHIQPILFLYLPWGMFILFSRWRTYNQVLRKGRQNAARALDLNEDLAVSPE